MNLTITWHSAVKTGRWAALVCRLFVMMIARPGLSMVPARRTSSSVASTTGLRRTITLPAEMTAMPGCRPILFWCVCSSSPDLPGAAVVLQFFSNAYPCHWHLFNFFLKITVKNILPVIEWINGRRCYGYDGVGIRKEKYRSVFD